MGVLAAAEPPAGSKVGECRIKTIKDLVDDEDRAAIDRYMETKGARSIADWLSSNGFDIGETTVRRHRNRGCPCFKKRTGG